MEKELDNCKPGTPIGDGDLQARRNLLDAETAIFKARKRGLELDLGLVKELVSLGEKFDKKKLGFLAETAKGGTDPNSYLQNLLAIRKERPIEDERKIRRIDDLVDRLIGLLEILQRRPDLIGYANRDRLKLLAGKIEGLAD
jgi:hypothetical protein